MAAKRAPRRGLGADARLRALVMRADTQVDPLAKTKTLASAIALTTRGKIADGRLNGVLRVQYGQALAEAPTRRGDFADRRRARAISSVEAGLAALSSRTFKVERAHGQIVLANIFLEHARASSDLERARELYLEALAKLNRRANAEDWALAQMNLGLCYFHRARGVRDENLARSVEAFNQALKVYTRERAPVDWIAGHLNKAAALSEFDGGSRQARQEEAIRAVERALGACARRTMPDEWARCQNLLGSLYYERVPGDRAENIERAISALDGAMRIRGRAGPTSAWRACASNLALALSDRIKGRRSQNQERALKLLDRVAAACGRMSFEWAKAQTKRAAILHERVLGRRDQNLERALSAARGALAIFDAEQAPREWANATFVAANALIERAREGRLGYIEDAIAMLEALMARLPPGAFRSERATAALNLGSAYSIRIAGSRADNIERAIAYSRQALDVFTREAAPIDWASLQANLGACYFQRARGDRRANLERAIKANTSALEVLDRATYPSSWAGVMLNLANLHRDRLVGDRADNLKEALRAVTAALEVLDPRSAPVEWAAAHQVHASVLLHMPSVRRDQDIARAIRSIEAASNVYAGQGMRLEWAHARATLATLLLNRTSGQRADNIEHAMVASSEALSVLSVDDDPMHWAQAQGDLAIAYFERSRGSRNDNIEAGIAAARAASSVYSREATPQEWARAQGNLASFFIVRERGLASENASRAIRALRHSLSVFSKRRNPFEWAQGAMNLALALQRLTPEEGGGLVRSISLLEEVLVALNRRDHPLDWAMAKTNLGNALRWRGEGDGDEWTKAAIDAYRDALSVFTQSRFPNEHLRTLRLLGTAYGALGAWRQADAAFSRARRVAALLLGQGLNAGERERVLAEISHLGPDGAYARWRLGDGLGALERLEAGRAVELTLKARLSDSTLPPRDRARLRTLMRAYDVGEARLARANLSQRKSELKRLEKSRRALEQHAGLPDEKSALTKELIDLTNAGAVVIAPIVTQMGSALLRARRRDDSVVVDGVSIAPPQASPADEFAVMGPSIRLLTTSPSAPASEAAWQLYGAGLSDLEPGQDLIVLASGDNVSPSLAIGGDVAFIEHHQLSLAPNIASAARARRRGLRKSRPTLGAVVDPAANLDGAILEHRFAAALFEQDARKVALRSQADADAARRALAGSSYWLVATHGSFDASNPRRSKLALARGQSLGLDDIASLSGGRSPRLVVLSACESGMHERRFRPEEFQGFATAFLQIGAGGVVAANWPVDDAASCFTIGRFFELHLREGLSPARALQHAQSWLRRACADELLDTIRAQRRSMSALEAAAARRLAARLRTRLNGPAPFADPVHWAAYSLWGA